MGMVCKKCVYQCPDGTEHSFVGEVGNECAASNTFKVNGEDVRCQLLRMEEPTEAEKKEHCGGWL